MSDAYIIHFYPEGVGGGGVNSGRVGLDFLDLHCELKIQIEYNTELGVWALIDWVACIQTRVISSWFEWPNWVLVYAFTAH